MATGVSGAAAAIDRDPSQPAVVSVIYPAGAKFDLDYYLKTHMPLVSKQWTPYGLKSWTIVKLPEDSGFCIQALLFWEKIEHFVKAHESEAAKAVMDDIKVFSDKAPKLWVGSLELSG